MREHRFRSLQGAWRTVFSGSVAVPSDFLGLSILRWPDSNTTVSTPPSFSYGHNRSLNYVGIGTGLSKWAAINTADGVYNWSEMDDWVTENDALGNSMMFCFQTVPSWCSASGTFSNVNNGRDINYGAGSAGPVASASLGKVDTFVQALLTRYNKASGGFVGSDKTRIKYLQAWNEPRFDKELRITLTGTVTGTPSGTITDSTTTNTATFSSYDAATKILRVTDPSGVFTKGGAVTWSGGSGTIKNAFDGLFASSWCGTAADLSAVTRQIAIGRDAVDTNVVIVGPAWTFEGLNTFSWATTYMDASDGSGGTAKDHLDGQGYNPYNYWSPLIKGFSSTLSVEKMMSQLTTVSATLPIYLTECGLSISQWNDNARDAKDFCRAMIIALVKGAKLMNVYAWDITGFYPASVSAPARDYLRQMHELLSGKTVTKLEENMRTLELRITYSGGTQARF